MSTCICWERDPTDILGLCQYCTEKYALSCDELEALINLAVMSLLLPSKSFIGILSPPVNSGIVSPRSTTSFGLPTKAI